MIIDLDYAFIIAFVAWGFVGSYEFFAKSQGWPVADWFERWSTGAILIVPMAVAVEWYHRGWQRALIALVAGFILAYLLTLLLRQRVQTLWAGFGLFAVAWISVGLLLKFWR